MPGYVLVVDDDPNVTKLIMDIVRLLGIEARNAANGQIALDLIKQETPGVIILDLMMPIMDGFTMLTQLRKEPYGRDIPVIVLSALADQSGTMERLPGIAGTIVKGKFSLTELNELLVKVGLLKVLPGAPAPAQAPSIPAPAAAEVPTAAAPTPPAALPVPPAPPLAVPISTPDSTPPTPPAPAAPPAPAPAAPLAIPSAPAEASVPAQPAVPSAVPDADTAPATPSSPAGSPPPPATPKSESAPEPRPASAPGIAPSPSPGDPQS